MFFLLILNKREGRRKVIGGLNVCLKCMFKFQNFGEEVKKKITKMCSSERHILQIYIQCGTGFCMITNQQK